MESEYLNFSFILHKRASCTGLGAQKLNVCRKHVSFYSSNKPQCMCIVTFLLDIYDAVMWRVFIVLDTTAGSQYANLKSCKTLHMAAYLPGPWSSMLIASDSVGCMAPTPSVVS